MHMEERRLVAAFSVGLLTAQDRMAPMSNSWKSATAHWGRDGQNISKSEFSSCDVCDYTRPKNPGVLFLNSNRTLYNVHEESILKTILGFRPSEVW